MSVDDTVIKLLSQADGTQNAEEAAAYAGKAQELATKHGLNIEVLRLKQADRGKREQPTMREIVVGRLGASGRRGAPGNKYFVMLFSVIARANDVKIDIHYHSDKVDAYGFPSDIDVCEALFNFIAAQMVEGCTRDIVQGKHKEAWVSARDYKGNYYESYRDTIHVRLVEARRAAIKAFDDDAREIQSRVGGTTAAAPSGETGAALVLVNKAAEVSDYHKRRSHARGSYGYSGREVGTYSSAARANGSAAGREARITATKALPGEKKAIA